MANGPLALDRFDRAILEVLATDGRVVLHHTASATATTTIPVAALPPGIYLLRADQGRLLGRFVKE